MKVAIVGAGPAGLAAGWELKSRGIAVDIFEGHSKPGGCASYFRRAVNDNKILFDAGATVLWSLRPGDFFAEQLKKWGINHAPFIAHSEHRFSLDGKTFSLDCQSEASWIRSLVREFPQDEKFITQNFPSFFHIARTLNEILYRVPAEPFLSLKNIVQNVKLAPAALKLAPFWLRHPGTFADLLAPTSPAFRAWANSLLLITLQARAEDVHTLYGITALCFFPLGAGALSGGMASLFEPLMQQFPAERARIFMRTPVRSITQDKGYTVVTTEQSFAGYSHVLLSCPRWNSEKLFSERLFDDGLGWEKTKDKLWSAVVAYLAINDHPQLPASAFNHLVKIGESELYFSVAERNDTRRGPSPLRAVTASTHERLEQWNFSEYQKKKPFAGRELYEVQKKTWAEIFGRAAQDIFGQAPVFVEIGSPKTFQAYTQRRDGFVGGIPLIHEFSFLKSPSQETQIPNVFQIGDTAFPGQSVVNCSVGAMEAVRKILSSC